LRYPTRPHARSSPTVKTVALRLVQFSASTELECGEGGGRAGGGSQDIDGSGANRTRVFGTQAEVRFPYHLHHYASNRPFLFSVIDQSNFFFFVANIYSLHLKYLLSLTFYINFNHLSY
jgi:hypothetical protein